MELAAQNDSVTEVTTQSNNPIPDRSKYKLSYFALASFLLIALSFLAFNVWKEMNDRNLITPDGFTNLRDAHYWSNNGNSVQVQWLTHKSQLVKDIGGIKHVKIFAKATVKNQSNTHALTINSLTLELLTQSGVKVFSKQSELAWKKTRYTDRRIQPDDTRDTTLEFFIPIAVYKDVQKLSARLGYNHESLNS